MDIKTSSKPWPWWAIQLCIYQILYGQGVDRYSLWLRKDGRYELIPYTDDQDMRDAIAAIMVYHYRVRHGIIPGTTRPRVK